MTQSVVTKGHAPIQIHGETSTGAAEAILTDDAGRIQTSTNGVVTAVSGTLKTYMMTPTDAALVGPGTDAATKLWGGTCKAFRFKVADTVTTTHGLLYAYSTTASDDLSTTLNTFDGEFTTPTGAVNPNCVAQAIGESVGQWILWDGTTTIKTISCRLSVGATPVHAILETLE